MELGGLHHVTAVTANAPGNLAFYTRVLGLRLVKKRSIRMTCRPITCFMGTRWGIPARR